MTIERWRGNATGRNRIVRHDGIVYTVGIGPDAGPDIRAQTQASVALIEANLEEAGSDKTRMLSVQIFLADMSQKAEMDEVWEEWIGPDWQHWPQRACVGAPLARNMLVEIVVKAAVK